MGAHTKQPVASLLSSAALVLSAEVAKASARPRWSKGGKPHTGSRAAASCACLHHVSTPKMHPHHSRMMLCQDPAGTPLLTPPMTPAAEQRESHATALCAERPGDNATQTQADTHKPHHAQQLQAQGGVTTQRTQGRITHSASSWRYRCTLHQQTMHWADPR